ncbi:MAG TPA: hypothetical protein DCS93_42230 [Microscillaceae bacterium]|nr:hypothetical protein [Microscillaceae bacterium]
MSVYKITTLMFLRFLLSSLFITLVLLPSCRTLILGRIDSAPRQLVRQVPHNFNGKVIIVGAGAAGLAAATILQQHGVDFQILEATDHYGGRVRKNTTFADFPIDLGAEWIHQKKEILNRLVADDSTDWTEATIPYRTLDTYWWDGTEYSKESRLGAKIAYWAYPEFKFKNTTWYDYLDKYFASKVKSKIVYNALVTNIDYTGPRVTITTKDGAQYEADKVIVTVSVGVLQKKLIQFNPVMPPKKLTAIQSVEFLPGFKLFMKFSEKFYPDLITCNTPKGEKVYYDVAFQKGAKTQVLGLLAMGPSTKAYYKLASKKQILEAALKELDVMFKGQASKAFTGEYLLQDWGRHAHTLGTWTNNEASWKTLQWLAKPLKQQVYFAGETYNIYDQRSTVHGAIVSGYTAVYELLEPYKTK